MMPPTIARDYFGAEGSLTCPAAKRDPREIGELVGQEDDMGLADVLNSMQNDPSGQRAFGSGGGGMSPLTMALLGLLAYKAIKSFSAGQPSAAPGPGAPAGANIGAPGTGPNAAGSLGDLLKGVLGGGAAGTALSGGLNDLLKQLQQNGQGDVANSWVGTGQNKAIAPKDLASALGADRINALMAYSGMSREDMLNGLSQHLPNVVDKLTPDGRLPTEEEAARLV
jgi:uncharacterized protein YidB (DUF937 family)